MTCMIAMICVNCLSVAAQPAEVLVYVGHVHEPGQ